MPTDTGTMDKDALITAIGQSLVADDALADADWDGYALVVFYDGDDRRLGGFRYLDGAGAKPATPRSPELAGLVDQLRTATRVDDKAPWQACVLRIRRDTGRFTVEFEYDMPERWRIGPDSLPRVIEQARPAA